MINEKTDLVQTGIQYFGLSVFLAVPKSLDVDPVQAAEGFTNQINKIQARANHPTWWEMCELSSRMSGMQVDEAICYFEQEFNRN